MYKSIITVLNKGLGRSNIIFILAEKSIRILYSLFLGALMYRQLGVESTGSLSILLTYFALMQFVSAGGLNELNVVNLKLNKSDQNGYIMSTYYIQLIYSFIISIVVLFYLRSDFEFSLLLILIISVLIRFNNVNKSQHEVESNWRGLFFRELIIILVLILHRTIGIYFSFGLKYFLSGILIESLVFLAVYGISFNYSRIFQTQTWETFKSGVPILLQGFIIMLIMKADMLTVSQRFSSYEAGIYSVGIKISEALYFLPMAVGTFVLPALLKDNRMNDLLNIRLHIIKHLKYVVPLVLLLITFSEDLVLFLFGEEFLISADILKVHTISLIFVLIGVLGDKFYLINKRTDLLFKKALLSGTIYLIISYYFVETPFHLAWVVLGFQVLNGLFIDLLFKEGRKLFRVKLNALFLLDYR